MAAIAPLRDVSRVTVSSGDRAVSMTGEQFDHASKRLGGNVPARIPMDMQFEQAGADFLAAPEVERIADQLVGDYSELGHLTEYRLAYAWKRTGGESAGKPVFGKCVKSSGLVRFFGKNQFVIWLAADHCREYGFTERQLEALIYHELCHAGEVEDKNGDMKAALNPHDVEAFASEIERYGLWTTDLQRVKPYFDDAQLDLPGFGE